MDMIHLSNLHVCDQVAVFVEMEAGMLEWLEERFPGREKVIRDVASHMRYFRHIQVTFQTMEGLMHVDETIGEARARLAGTLSVDMHMALDDLQIARPLVPYVADVPSMDFIQVGAHLAAANAILGDTQNLAAVINRRREGGALRRILDMTHHGENPLQAARRIHRMNPDGEVIFAPFTASIVEIAGPGAVGVSPSLKITHNRLRRLRDAAQAGETQPFLTMVDRLESMDNVVVDVMAGEFANSAELWARHPILGARFNHVLVQGNLRQWVVVANPANVPSFDMSLFRRLRQGIALEKSGSCALLLLLVRMGHQFPI